MRGLRIAAAWGWAVILAGCAATDKLTQVPVDEGVLEHRQGAEQPAPEGTQVPGPARQAGPTTKRVDPPSADGQREQALYQAALERWQTGDLAGCETQLQRLIGRNPRHLEARLLLADLHVATDNASAAEQELRELAAELPREPRVQLALGLLLDSTGRNREARGYLKQAADLEPQVALYAEAYTALAEKSQPGAAAAPAGSLANVDIAASLSRPGTAPESHAASCPPEVDVPTAGTPKAETPASLPIAVAAGRTERSATAGKVETPASPPIASKAPAGPPEAPALLERLPRWEQAAEATVSDRD